MIWAVERADGLLGHEAEKRLTNRAFGDSIWRWRKGKSQNGVIVKLAYGSQKRNVGMRRAGAHGQGTRMGYSHKACR